MLVMSEFAHDLADGAVAFARAHAAQLHALAAAHGLSQLRITPTGRLLVAVDERADYFDIIDFASHARQLLDRDVDVLPDGVLRNEFAGDDLHAARPL